MLVALLGSVVLGSVVLGPVMPAAAAPAPDPYRGQQYGLDLIRLPQVWSLTRGEGVVIAVVDTGIDLDHPDLVDQLLRDDQGRVVGRDLVDDDDVPEDAHGHGTMVAGVIAAAAGNGEGGEGAVPGARLMPVRVLDGDARGRTATVGEGIRWAVDHGADVVNLSLESVSGVGGSVPEAPAAAVRYAWDRGVAVVAAAGNSARGFSDYPADTPVLLVGAAGRDGQRAGFSNTGRSDAVLAPGVEIVSTWCRPPGGGLCDGRLHNYGQADGTSFAAPYVSGAVAALMATGLDNVAAIARLRETAVDRGVPGPDAETGFGLIDVAAAVGVAQHLSEAGGFAAPDPVGPGGAVGDTPVTAASPPRDADPPTRNPARASGLVPTLLMVIVAAATVAAFRLRRRLP